MIGWLRFTLEIARDRARYYLHGDGGDQIINRDRIPHSLFPVGCLSVWSAKIDADRLLYRLMAWIWSQMRAVAVRLRAPRLGRNTQHRPGAHGTIRAHDSLRQRSWILLASTLRFLLAQTSNGTIITTLYLATSPCLGDTISSNLARSRVERPSAEATGGNFTKRRYQ